MTPRLERVSPPRSRPLGAPPRRWRDERARERRAKRDVTLRSLCDCVHVDLELMCLHGRREREVVLTYLCGLLAHRRPAARMYLFVIVFILNTLVDLSVSRLFSAGRLPPRHPHRPRTTSAPVPRRGARCLNTVLLIESRIQTDYRPYCRPRYTPYSRWAAATGRRWGGAQGRLRLTASRTGFHELIFLASSK